LSSLAAIFMREMSVQVISVTPTVGNSSVEITLLQSTDGAGDRFSAELGSETIPVNVGGEVRVLEDLDQDLAISLSCGAKLATLVDGMMYIQCLPSQVIPGILLD
jgi:hypothetical protein